jgi:hypothetical protein
MQASHISTPGRTRVKLVTPVQALVPSTVDLTARGLYSRSPVQVNDINTEMCFFIGISHIPHVSYSVRNGRVQGRLNNQENKP